MAELERGVVKWFNDAKGFGFIEHPSGRDVFVHYSVIQSDGFKTLKDGEDVEYELSEGDKGLHAKRVVRLNSRAKTSNAAQETDAAKEARESQFIAPKLESGLLNARHQTTASLIEIERESSEAETGLGENGLQPAIAAVELER